MLLFSSKVYKPVSYTGPMHKSLSAILLSAALLTTACSSQPDLYRWRTEMDGNLVPRPPRAKPIVHAEQPAFHPPQSEFRYLGTSTTNTVNGRICTVTELAFTTHTETLTEFTERLSRSQLPLDSVGYHTLPGFAFPERYVTVPEANGTIVGGKPGRLTLVHPEYH